MTNLEIEYKTLLTIDEFRRLDGLYQQFKPIQQTNYYIDSADFILKSKRLSLRIRTYVDRAELTLKIPQDIGNLEFNQSLDLETVKSLKQEFIIPDGLIRDKLLEKKVPLDALSILGHLTTRRREVPLDIGLLAIDSNIYADIKDYELELEVTDAEQGLADFERFLDKHQINFKYAKSKVARFASTLKKKY
ncbi:CYTH domain-containing protein [Streptococcus entericus]|uniref:CYTH domain-containing protein n=1 Tax=Streptococcus entericus TaxID=155680 RepID=UPI000369CD08|nr:CYTH domain-containing protein [Streptococcus entericus]